MKFSTKKMVSLALSLFIATSGMATFSTEKASAASVPFLFNYGGTGNDSFQSIQPTSDGGYIVAGSSASNDGDLTGLNKGGTDAILVKYSGSGSVLWTKTFGGTGNETFYSVQQTSDGGYIAVGSSGSADGNLTGLNKGGNDAILVKYDQSGNVLWTKTFGGKGDDIFQSIDKTIDGGYIVAGYSASTDGDLTGLNKGGNDAILVKYDATGNVLWKKDFGGTSSDYFRSVIQASDGGFVVVGSTASKDGDVVVSTRNSDDSLIVKFDANGNVLQKAYYDRSGWSDYFNSVKQTNDGGYIAVGASYTSGAGEYGTIIKYSNTLTTSSSSQSQYLTGQNTYFQSVIQRANGSYVAVGYAYGGWGYIPVLATFSPMVYGGAQSSAFATSYAEPSTMKNYLFSIAPTPTGGYIAVGSATYTDFWESGNSSSKIAHYGTTDTSDGAIVKFSPSGALSTNDNLPPTVNLSTSGPSVTSPDVVISVDATDDTKVTQIKWAKGNHDANYFASSGTDITKTPSFGAITNGEYTVWASDAEGNQTVKTINVTNVNVDWISQYAQYSQYSKLISGSRHSLIVGSDGSVKSWGYNAYGELGDGTKTNQATPVQASGLTNIAAVSAGMYHSLALKSDGTVWAWGYNVYGELGNGTTTNQTSPIQVSNLSNVIDIAGGAYHSLALKSDGTVWAWGYNSSGQLGDGTTTNQTTPKQVPGLTDVVDVSAGDTYSLALKSDGTVWAWGSNGVSTQTNVPTQVPNLSSIVAISGGGLALKSDGSVWAWGSNSNGQLGNGTTTSSTTPVQVSGLLNVVAIGGGSLHNLALKSDGSVWAWGNNSFGQLGTGNNATPTPPMQVANLTDVIAVSAGLYHSLALKSDGSVWSWGDNEFNQLGDGTTTNEPFPVQIPGLSGVSSPDSGAVKAIQAELDAMQANLQNGNFKLDDLNNYKDRLSELTNEVLALSSNSKKDALLQQIANLSDLIDQLQAQIADATAKVVTAEGSQKQTDVDTARSAVNGLSNGQIKLDLSNRLDVVQAAIDANNVLQAQIADATAKVVTAEGSQKQADVDTARTAVNALPSGQTKTDLSNRLDAVQQAIDAYNALQAQIADATAKVVTAEGSQKQADVDTARTAVNALPNGQTKTNLSNRLDAVQQAIDANATAQSIQDELNTMQGNLENGNFTLSDLDNYKDRLSELVDEVLVLPSGSTQDALLQQISNLSDLIDLIKSVFAAESTGDVTGIDLNQLNNLPDSPLKDQLQQKADEAQQVADAIDAATALVVTAEQSKLPQDVDVARNAVDALPDSQAKTDLENRLEVVQSQVNVNNATALVVKLEGSYAQTDVTPAQNAVNALPASSEKTVLQNRINIVTKFLSDLSVATAKVVTAEATKAQADVDAARTLVNALADRPEKTALLNRLDAIQVGGQVVYTNISDIADPAVRNLLKDVDFYVTQAEKYFIRDNITLAKDKVVGIPTNISSDPRYAVICQNLKDRTNYLITLFNQQLADAQLQTAINNATTAVANYEKYKTAYYKSRAQTAINALPDGAVKDGLQARFDAVV